MATGSRLTGWLQAQPRLTRIKAASCGKRCISENNRLWPGHNVARVRERTVRKKSRGIQSTIGFCARGDVVLFHGRRNIYPMTKPVPDPAGAASTPIIREYTDVAQWAGGAVAEIVAGLQASLQRTRHARLVLSGGSTPAPVYRALAGQPLDWTNVEIALGDERWLPVGDPASNTQMVCDTLLAERARAAQFQPMLVSGRGLAETLAAANRNFLPASVLVLGMGPDGHTASLFPHMRGFSEAVQSTAPYLAVDASNCAGAGEWALRISLSPLGLTAAATRILLIRGEHKRRLLEQAMAGTDCAELPIRLLLSPPGPALHVHWCPD